MYCSSCGAVADLELSYCNRCGTKLAGTKNQDPAQPIRPESLVWGMVAIFVFGLLAIICLATLMKDGDVFYQVLIKVFTIASFLLMFGVETVFSVLLWRRLKTPREIHDSALLNKSTTKELAEPREPLLAQPMPSVTEQTTRPFEAIKQG